MKIERRTFTIIMISLVLNILIWCFSIGFIENLGNIISLFNEEQFALIFSQLEEGSTIVPPFIIPLILITLIMYLLFKKNNKLLFIKLPIILIVILLVQVISIMCSSVNGLYFVDIIISLINNLGGLGLWEN